MNCRTPLLFILTWLLALSATSQQQTQWKKRELAFSRWVEDIGQCAAIEAEKRIDVSYMMMGDGFICYLSNQGLHFKKPLFDSEQYNERFEEIEKQVKSSGLDYQAREELEHSLRKEAWLAASSAEWLELRWSEQTKFKIIPSQSTGAVYHFNLDDNSQLTGAKEFETMELVDAQTGAVAHLSAVNGGIKYAFTLTNATQTKATVWTWSENAALSISPEGTLNIHNENFGLRDARPTATDATGSEIPTNYAIQGNRVSFNLESAVPNWPIVIDPWLISVDSTSSQALNVIVDDNFDALVYVNAWSASLDYIKKFDTNGNLIWASVFSAIAGTDGDIEIEPETGSIYASSIATTSKYDSDGLLLWSNNFYEAWTLEFNCTEKQFVGGGNFGPNGSKLHNLDPETGATLTTFLLPNDSTSGYDEVRAATSSPQGDYYFLTLTTIFKVCPALQIDYQIPNNFVSIPYFGPLYHISTGGTPWSEYNAIAVDSMFLFSYDGKKIIKRIAISGVAVDSTFMNDGINLYNDGIIVDACGDIYVGGQSRVYKLNSSLQLLDSSAVLGTVYDLSFSDSGNILVAGNDFLAKINMTHCGKLGCVPLDTFPYTYSPDTVVCLGDSVELIATGGDSYFWFPDYNINRQDSSHVKVFPAVSTTYGVVIKQDSCHFKIGYVRVFVDTITTYVLPPDTVICAGDEVVLTVSGTASIFAIKSDDLAYQDTGTTFFLSPDSTMHYLISSLNLDSSGCSAGYNIEVLAFPDGVPVGPLLQCDNDSIEIIIDSVDAAQWQPADAVFPPTGTEVKVHLLQSGYVHYTIDDHGRCQWGDSIFVVVEPAPVLLTPFNDTVLCTGKSFNYFINGADFYQWTPDTGLSSDTSGSVLITPSVDVIYTIIGTDTFGCSNQTTLDVKILPLAEAQLAEESIETCLNDMLVLNAEGSGVYRMLPQNATKQINDSTFEHIATQTTELTLIADLPGHCPDSDRVQINIPIFSNINTADTFMCRFSELILEISDDVEVSWYPSFGIEYIGDNRYKVTANTSTTYRIVSANECLDQDSIHINVISCAVDIPNVLTPNGDGINDFFKLDGEIFVATSCTIYNRWGQVVYEGDISKFAWDGHSNGTLVSDGAYYYLIDAETIFKETKQFRGYVQVLR